ncbi:MAG: NUDIX hydrolase [Gammaproteobacteria bacterium]
MNDGAAPATESAEGKMRPVRPRDAASLIIFREGRSGAEILMGRRASKSRFMPDVYVFPGGTVDSTDARARPATHLDPDLTGLLAVGGRASRARALAMAAVRETFEETGLILGQPGHPGGVKDPSWQAMAAQGLAPDLARLRYVGRAITPTASPIRFHARFFRVSAEHLHGSARASSELGDPRWVAVSDLGTLPLAGITRFILRHATRQLEQPDDPQSSCVFPYTEHGRRVRYEGGNS